MVRSMMGTLIEIGLHRLDRAVINEILETQNRKLAGKMLKLKDYF